jgi:hypothetical protein
MSTPQRFLILCLAVVFAMGLGQTAADAAPKKQKFEVTFEGYWGVSWYVRLSDEEPHHVCLAGIGADGDAELEAWTPGKRKVKATLYADAKRGSLFGRVPIETAATRKLTFGQVHPGCEIEYGDAASRLNCDSGSPQWGRFGNPPAYLELAAGRGGIATGVVRAQRDELIDEVWDFCPFWGAYEGEIGSSTKLSAKKLFSGKPVSVKGYKRQDFPGGGGFHEQEGYTEWKLTIRYLGKRGR